jgi:hypothetical protein
MMTEKDLREIRLLRGFERTRAYRARIFGVSEETIGPVNNCKLCGGAYRIETANGPEACICFLEYMAQQQAREQEWDAKIKQAHARLE